MADPSLELPRESQTDRHPLLMEQPVDQSNPEHVIDFTRSSIATSPTSHIEHPSRSDTLPPERTPSNNTRAPDLPSSSIATSSRNSSFRRRSDRYGRRHRSPLNSGLWISIELTITASQIIASIIVLALSRHEKPHAPLFLWVVGYAAGCVATLPHLYWRYTHRNSNGPEQESTHGQLGSAQSNPPLESTAYTAISVPQISEEEHRPNGAPSSRFNMLVDHFKMALDCFFAVWFVVGNVWIFGGHSSASDAPNLYRLCIVFLTFSCIGYAMPFILCTTICCCLPCIISILGFREDHAQTRGAALEAISALPTYKFKSKGNGDREDSEINLESVGDGGVIGAGTEKERTISAEDAVCCICLAKYVDEEDLRELPCSHFFHVECVDKWLKINALCPLCKHEVGDGGPSDPNPGGRHGERRVGTDTTRDTYGGTMF